MLVNGWYCPSTVSTLTKLSDCPHAQNTAAHQHERQLHQCGLMWCWHVDIDITGRFHDAWRASQMNFRVIPFWGQRKYPSARGKVCIRNQMMVPHQWWGVIIWYLTQVTLQSYWHKHTISEFTTPRKLIWGARHVYLNKPHFCSAIQHLIPRFKATCKIMFR